MLDGIVRKYKALVLDGPLATELERVGCDLNDPLWSAKVLLEKPELIRAVHLDYFRAGADIATTASYQASIAGFMARGLSENEARDLIYRSIALAGEARDLFLAEQPDLSRRPRPLIAGSVGSYGAYLADGSEYRGDYALGMDELISFHRPRMSVLCDETRPYRVDFLAMETIPCLLEAKALVALLKAFPHLSAWISFSARDGAHTSQGDSIAEAASWLDRQAQIFAIGVNCVKPGHVAELVRNIRRASAKPIVVYPNSGEAYLADASTWRGPAETMGAREIFDAWRRDGARIIGGCCRTTPQFISDIANWRDGLLSHS